MSAIWDTLIFIPLKNEYKKIPTSASLEKAMSALLMKCWKQNAEITFCNDKVGSHATS